MTRALSLEEVRAALEDLPGWSITDNKLHKEFRFADFSEAFAFMTRVAMVAERLNHHPQWSNSYRVVVIDLYRHTHGDITDMDVTLATQIEKIVSS